MIDQQLEFYAYLILKLVKDNPDLGENCITNYPI